MGDEPVYDYAIVGAGVSGLVLARLLADSSLADRTVLLVDGARDDDELRTLSFWSAGPVPPFEALVRHRWSTLRVVVRGVPRDVALTEHTYRTLFFADLQRDVKRRLVGRPGGPGHRVVEGRLDALEQDAAGATLHVAGERFRARWVFDSRFHLRDLRVDRRRYQLLHQHFHGWVVRTPSAVFTPDVATLLDFDVGGGVDGRLAGGAPPGSAFCYVLPFTPSQALVELVTLDAVDAEPLVRAYLARRFGVTDVELVDREAGVSPLTEQPFAWRDGPRVRRLGVAAGRIKPSTGYAFTRIVDDAARVVRSLERHGHPFAAPPPARVHRLLDGVLLEIWANRPGEIPRIFGALFERNPADRVLRFLDERASPGDVLRLIASLPKRPFVLAAGRRARMIAGGAATRRE